MPWTVYILVKYNNNYAVMYVRFLEGRDSCGLLLFPCMPLGQTGHRQPQCHGTSFSTPHIPPLLLLYGMAQGNYSVVVIFALKG